MTLPLATTADAGQVEALRPYVAGQACVVLGSAPLARPCAALPGEVVIPVNGAISSYPWWPQVWVLNSKAQDKHVALCRELHRKMLEQGKGRSCGHLLLLRGPKVASEAYTLATLKQYRASCDTWSVLDKPTKGWLEAETCGRPRPDDREPCSSGLLAVAAALWCGAAHVRLVGFSWAPGYQYLPKAQPAPWWRDHISADKRALACLARRYPGRLSGELLRGVAA